MRRLGRWTINVLIVLSLAVSVAAAVLWMYSYRRPVTRVIASRADCAVFASSEHGEFRVWSQEVSPPPPPDIIVTLTSPFLANVADPAATSVLTINWPQRPPVIERYGWSRAVGPGGTVYDAGAPYSFSLATRQLLLPWSRITIFGALPFIAAMAIRAVRGRRVPPGCCPACRYDLTGNVSGVCPECGTKVTQLRRTVRHQR